MALAVDPSKIRKILVIQIRPFGDVLLATSYLGALKAKFPHAEIDFLVSEPFQVVLENNPFLNTIIVSPRKGNVAYFWGRLKVIYKVAVSRYDLVIDQQNGVGSRIILLLSRARYRLGWDKGKSHFFCNLHAPTNGTMQHVGPRYAATRNFDMVFPLGIEEQPYNLFYHVKPESRSFAKEWFSAMGLEGETIILVSPGSREPQKTWNTGHFAKLSDLIVKETAIPVVIIWGPGEKVIAESMGGMMEQKSILAPPTTMNQAAAFMEMSKLLICNDGGLNHVSVATRTPSFAIFGVTGPGHWSPQGTFPFHYHLFVHNGDKQPGNTFGISPEEAFVKVQEVLAELDKNAMQNTGRISDE